ncbi:peptidyl-prolyl cis-trans isomerase Pin1, variant 2 [Bonamia ostreae]
MTTKTSIKTKIENNKNDNENTKNDDENTKNDNENTKKMKKGEIEMPKNKNRKRKLEFDLNKERIRCSHILVKHVNSRRPKSWRQRSITRTREEAKNKIENLLKSLRKDPKNFVEIAKTESDCSSHVTGGDLGYFSKSRMQKEFEDAAFALSKGSISEPIETKSGYHLILRID